MRLWLLTPITGVSDAYQILIGFDFATGPAPVPPSTIPTESAEDLEYYRIFMSDPTTIGADSTLLVARIWSVVETSDDLAYFRTFMGGV